MLSSFCLLLLIKYHAMGPLKDREKIYLFRLWRYFPDFGYL
jgi:hypothetical protein